MNLFVNTTLRRCATPRLPANSESPARRSTTTCAPSNPTASWSSSRSAHGGASRSGPAGQLRVPGRRGVGRLLRRHDGGMGDFPHPPPSPPRALSRRPCDGEHPAVGSTVRTTGDDGAAAAGRDEPRWRAVLAEGAAPPG